MDWGGVASGNHRGGQPAPRAWGAAAGALLLIVAVAHVLCWAPFPNDVDPMNFVASLRGFDVSHDAPHAPGYPLYVGAARVACLLVGEGHAFQLVNLLCILGMGGMGFWAWWSLGHGALGFAWLVLIATHPLVWAATIVPESYITDAAAGTCVVACAVLLRSRPDWQAVAGVSAIILLQGLLRPVSAVMLQPAAIVACSLLAGVPSLRRGTYTLVCTSACVAGAYAFVVWCAGGSARYSEAARSVMLTSFRESSVLAGAPLGAHLRMIAKYAAWLAFLGGPGVALALAGWLCSRRSDGGDAHSADPTRRWRWACVAGAWFLPSAAVYVLCFYLKPTYHLISLPLLVGVGVVGAGWLVRGRRGVVVAAAFTVGAAQLAFFLLGGRAPLPDPLHRLTLGGLHQPSEDVGRFLDAAEELPDGRGAVVLLRGKPLPGNVRAVRLVRRDLAAYELAPVPGGLAAVAVSRPHPWSVEALDPPMGALPAGIDEVLVVWREGGRLEVKRLDVGSARDFPSVAARATDRTSR